MIKKKRLTISKYVRLYSEEAEAVQKIADSEHLGNVSFAIRKLITEALEARNKDKNRKGRRFREMDV